MKIKSMLIGLQITPDLLVTNYRELGLRSPKLSKALLARGFSNNVVSLLMQALQRPLPELTSSEDDVLRQGDTPHFRSCQASDRPQNRTKEDAEAAKQGYLYLAVVRTPEGFLYRVKVRRCLDPDTGETIGWFLDREYGQGRPSLVEFAQILREAGEPAYNRLAFREPRHSLEGWETVHMQVRVPSASFGYQDTLHGEVHNLKFSLVEESQPHEISLPIRKNPFREQGVLEEALRELLYGPRMPDPRQRSPRPPEEVVLRRMLKQIRRENPHVSWVMGRRDPRHRVEVWGNTAVVRGSIPADGISFDLVLHFDSASRRWKVERFSLRRFFLDGPTGTLTIHYHGKVLASAPYPTEE